MTVGPMHEGETSARRRPKYELVPRAARRVLDVGCGAGQDVFALAEKFGAGCLIVGIDVSLDRIDEAERTRRNVALNVRFVVGDARSLPFDDESFDVVRADGLLFEISERGRVVRELARVTAPGGRVLVHDVAAALTAVDGDDDLMTLMQDSGLASVELSETEGGLDAPAQLCVTLMGIKAAATASHGNP